MEIQTNVINTILEQLRKHAAEKQIALIIEARIFVNPHEARVLVVRPTLPLAVIRY